MNNKNVPRLRFPGFEGEWEEKRLGEISKITTGSTPPTSVKEFYDGDYLFISPVDLNNGRYIETTKTTLTEAGFRNGRIIKKNSTLFVSIGSTIGKVGQTSCNSVTNQQINALEAHKQYIDDFIYFILLKNGKRIKLLAGVQAVPQINKTDFSNCRFKFPTLPEQTRIAVFLTAVDKRVSLLQKKKEALEQYKKGIMQKIFSQKLRFKDENDNDFPDWEEKKLGDIGSFIGGGTPDSTNEEYWKGDVPWISSSDLCENSISKINITRFITGKAVKESATKIIPKNSVLIVSRVGIGKFAVSSQDLCTSQDFTNMITNENPWFLAYYFSAFSGRFIRLAQGTSIKGFTGNDLRTLKFFIPSLPEQQKIASFLSSIDRAIEQVASQIELSQSWKNWLLQRMFV